MPTPLSQRNPQWRWHIFVPPRDGYRPTRRPPHAQAQNTFIINFAIVVLMFEETILVKVPVHVSLKIRTWLHASLSTHQIPYIEGFCFGIH